MISQNKKIDTLFHWIEETAATATGLLIPVSGGSDSALCFWLCTQVFPEKTFAVHARSLANDAVGGRELRAASWFESVGEVEYVDIPGTHEKREEMRWARFLSLGLSRRAWLVSSRNRTEDLLGTYSLASRLCTYLPLVGTWKSDVLALAAFVDVPEEIIASSLRADPDCGRPQELAEIPFEKVETFLKVRYGEALDAQLSTLTLGQLQYLDAIHRHNVFKATLPIRGPRHSP